MSVAEITQHYIDYLILQYRNIDTAKSTIETLVKPTIMDLLPASVRDAFDIDTAVGNQLDFLGKYIDANRVLNIGTSITTLPDSDYRTFLKVKIAKNNLGSSFSDLQSFIKDKLDGILIAFDHQNMTMSFFLNSNYMSLVLAIAMVKLDILPKPMGVSYSSLIYLASLENIFGMVTYGNTSLGVAGFNDYTDYDTATQFLKYEDAIII